jgi:hypothetical protein
MLMILSNPASWVVMSKEDPEAMWDEHRAIGAETTASGEYVMAARLADPSHSRTVTVRDGVPATTDGPFAEAKEHLAGFYIVDCETPERAAELAARIPDARFLAVEVRPFIEDHPEPTS